MVPRLAMNLEKSNNNGIQSADDAVASTSSCFANESYIRRSGESIGIVNLSESVVRATSENVMYVLRQVIKNSAKYANHSRRRRILAEDVDAALQAEKKSPQFGFKTRDHIPLRLSGSGGRDVYVDEDREIELAPIYTALPGKVPAKPDIKAHWLVIDGQQPAVPENPIPDEASQDEGDKKKPNVMDEVFDDGSRILTGKKKTEAVNAKTLTTHTLSLEQQVFFKEIIEVIMGYDDGKRAEALHSLKTDAGLQPLVSRFSLTVTEGVKCNIVQHNLAFLIYLMRLVHSLSKNTAVSLEKVLHELLPSIMSCILSKNLSATDTESHWALREFSARLLAELCRKYHVLDVQSRVTKVLTKVWTDDYATFPTVYGAVYALNELGVETVRAVVVPRTPNLYDKIRHAQTDRANASEAKAAEKVNVLVTEVLVNFVRSQQPADLREFADYVTMFGGFADGVFRVVAADLPPPRVASTPIRTLGHGVSPTPVMTGRPFARATPFSQLPVTTTTRPLGSPAVQRGSGTPTGQVRYVPSNSAPRRPPGPPGSGTNQPPGPMQ